MPFLYLIAIAWIYVVLYMSITESSIVAGIMTFIFYCVIPLSLVIYVLRSPARKRRIKALEAEKRRAAIEAKSTPAKSD
ncbi:MAG: hypothetical protein HY253_02660 [Burkholderiales bacterium]|nr:hypothetical protein [Burkholderiales bacterium]